MCFCVCMCAIEREIWNAGDESLNHNVFMNKKLAYFWQLILNLLIQLADSVGKGFKNLNT